jgi:hypothetical protein
LPARPEAPQLRCPGHSRAPAARKPASRTLCPTPCAPAARPQQPAALTSPA